MGNTLAIAGQKLIRGISQKFIGDPYIAEAAVIVPSQFRNNPGNPNWFFGPNGIDYRFIFDGATSASKAYLQCPPLAAIINRKAQAYINGKTVILNSQGKPASGDHAGRIMKLLRKPNLLQSWRQFEAQHYTYCQLFGFCITLPIYPAGFEALGDPSQASSLWNIPPYMIAVEETNKLWFQAKDMSDIVKRIVIKYKDVHFELQIDDVFIFKDFAPNFDSQVFPTSRIRPLAMPINNIIASLESRNELINYAGSQGILTPESDTMGAIPLKESEKDQLQADFKRQYGIKKGQSRYIISPAAMKWQPMGKATRDLMLFEEIADDIMRLCDGFSYPSPLLNSEKGPSVSNTREFKAQVYQDGVMPESLDMYEQWESFFHLEETNLNLTKNYDHIPVLKSDQVDDGKAQLSRNQALLIAYQNDVITLNDWREKMGYDKTPDGDVFFSQSNQKKQADAHAVTLAINSNQNSNSQNEDDDPKDDQ
jgi:hypothetical protein